MSEQRKRRQWEFRRKDAYRIGRFGAGHRDLGALLPRRHPATQYYNWKSQLVSSAESVFGDKKKAKGKQREQERHEQVLRRKDAVIAKITAKNLELKKRSRTRRLWPASLRASATSRCRSEAGEEP